MNKFCPIIFVSCLTSLSLLSQVPIPAHIIMKKGRFVLPKGLNIKPGTKKDLLNITTLINKTADTLLGNEGYHLQVLPSQIKLVANTETGIFYGTQTLLQLIKKDRPSSVRYVSCTDIIDYPRFRWRGLMLDVTRHFFIKDEIKRFIDEMVQYKYNVLHLHLSDDQGWRVEIKSLPRLTSIGAWRVPRTGDWGNFLAAQANEQPTYGGFYTRDDIRELVQYAKERFVTIVPEIDVPAHSLAMIAAYPYLSCTQKSYAVDPGADFYGKLDNALCIGNDSVYHLLDKVFMEIAELFPGQYIHIGGDEAYKEFWKQCSKCQHRMQQEHLQSVDELQSYFIQRVAKIVESKGKKVIGWDEILEGGLAANVTVMSWRGLEGGIKATQMKHSVIMSPWGNAYLDLYQGDPSVEPRAYGKCRLSDCYHYDPLPDSIDAKYVLGGQGNIWTESIPNFRHLEYMMWPRAMALAEVFWSPKEKRNWNNFIARMKNEFPRLDSQHIKYSRSYSDAIIIPVKDKGGNTYIQLSTEISGLDIYYSFDGTDPDHFYQKYTGALLTFPPGASELKVVTYKNMKRLGRQIRFFKPQLDNL